MLTKEEIKLFMDEDAASLKKHLARIGERYFNGDHDIKSYKIKDVYFKFTHEVMSNEQENKQNELTDANRKNVEINMLMGLVNVFGNDLVIQHICDVLDIDYEEIKDQLPEDEALKVEDAQNRLDGIVPDDGGDTGE